MSKPHKPTSKSSKNSFFNSAQSVNLAHIKSMIVSIYSSLIQNNTQLSKHSGLIEHQHPHKLSQCRNQCYPSVSAMYLSHPITDFLCIGFNAPHHRSQSLKPSICSPHKTLTPTSNFHILQIPTSKFWVIMALTNQNSHTQFKLTSNCWLLLLEENEILDYFVNFNVGRQLVMESI